MRNKKFTLLIPTYNRPSRLKKALSYYYRHESSNKPFIKIIDSSSVDFRSKNKDVVNSFKELLEIEYVEAPEKISLFGKIKMGLDLSVTEIVATSADDDYLLLGRSDKYINFLLNNKDYIYTFGSIVKFGISERVGLNTRQVVREFEEANSADVVKRVAAQRKSMASYFWGYYRKSLLDKALSLAIKSDLCNNIVTPIDEYAEYIMYFWTVIIGKTHLSNYPSYLMVRHNDTETNNRISAGSVQIRSTRDFEKKREQVRNILTEYSDENLLLLSKSSLCKVLYLLDDFFGFHQDSSGFTKKHTRKELLTRLIKNPRLALAYVNLKYVKKGVLYKSYLAINSGGAYLSLDSIYKSEFELISSIVDQRDTL